MPTTFDIILLGTAPDLDTDESTFGAERTFGNGVTAGSAANPLSDRIARVAIDDADGDNRWDQDGEAQPETSTLTTNGVSETVTLDTVSVYNATVTFQDGSTATITAVLGQLSDGRVYLFPEFSANADSTALSSGPIQSLTLNGVIQTDPNLVADRNDNEFVPCFAAGTPILTPGGEVPAQRLRAGAVVSTFGGGRARLRWTGVTAVPAIGANAPIRFAPGTIGNDRPLRLSGNHRVLIGGWRAQLYFGEEEVLVPAKALVDGRGVRQVPAGIVRYVHLLTDRHEVLVSAGAPTESLHPGNWTLAAMSAARRAEILAAVPSLPDGAPPLARPVLTAREGRLLAA